MQTNICKIKIITNECQVKSSEMRKLRIDEQEIEHSFDEGARLGDHRTTTYLCCCCYFVCKNTRLDKILNDVLCYCCCCCCC